ncbi:hypothetical protein [Viridibacillus arvi]|uniref:hypothetical protein n=1 Tax=Viridibacillus arvi TaxID=263475 RepID=UPI0034CD8E54
MTQTQSTTMHKTALYRFRKSLNLRPTQCANALGICEKSYQLKEYNRRQFTLEEAFNLSKYLKITMEQLFKLVKEG